MSGLPACLARTGQEATQPVNQVADRGDALQAETEPPAPPV